MDGPLSEAAMDCEHAREDFVERLTGSLDPARSKAVDEHISGCAECRAETGRMREMWAELGTLGVPAASGSASRVERLIDARSPRHAGSPPLPARGWGASRIALSAVALAASLIIGVLVGRGFSTESSDSAASSPIAAANAKEKYVLLLHGPARTVATTAAAAAADSATEHALVAEYSAWAGRLAAEGVLVGGEKLADEPLTMLTSNGTVDTPRFTADELGGFFIIQAADSAEAYRIARDCPHLKHGGTVQVRRIDPT
jgi:hypothetical protein